MDDSGALNPPKEAPRERTGVYTHAVTTAPQTGQSITPWLMVVLAVVLFAGGLFGYDQGVISGALLGALAAGELADRIGRKHTVLIAGTMFTLDALVQALAPDTLVLVAGRLIIGAGVGAAASSPPTSLPSPSASSSPI